VAAGHADVLVQRARLGVAGAVQGRLVRRHHAVGLGVEAGHRHRRRGAQHARIDVRRMGDRPHRMRDQPVERLDQGRRVAALRIAADRAAERHHAAHALRHLVRGEHREDPAQAPADEAHRAAMAVVQEAHLLLERAGVLALEADVAPEPPVVDLVAAIAQIVLEHRHRAGIADEARHQQHRMAVAARRGHQQRQRGRQQRGLEQRPVLEQRPQQAGRAGRLARGGHRSSPDGTAR